ncbi:mucin-4-like [Candoia aspera]|uniref:mucin-4-like n=1 Tax=Candoia aspera TaxID=51853 RepID=UPI002FD831C6
MTSPSPSSTVTSPSVSSTMTSPSASSTVTSPSASSIMMSPSASSTVTSPSASSTVTSPSAASTVTSPSASSTVTSPSPSSTVTSPSVSSIMTFFHSSSTVTSPSVSSTVTSLSASSTVTSPSPSSTVTSPSVSSTMTSPSPSSTVTSPSVSSTMTSPSASSTVTSPSASSIMTSPSASSTMTLPSTSSTVTSPSASSTVTSPSVSSTMTSPSASSIMTSPSASSTVTSPSRSSTVTSPSVSSTMTSPSASSTVTSPSASSIMTSPSPSSTVTSPSASSIMKSPSASSTATSPSASSTMTLPSTSSTVTSPSASSTVTSPSGSSTVTSPSASSTVTSPSASSTMTSPSTSSTVTSPSASSTVTSPSVSSTMTSPSVSSTMTSPSASSTVTSPSASSIMTSPSASSTVTSPSPSSTVTSPSVSSTMTSPSASSTVTLPSTSSTVTFFHRDIAVHFFHRDVALSVFHHDLSLRFFHRDIAVHFFHRDVALSVFHRDLSVRFFHHDVTLRFFHHDVPLSFFHRDIALRFFHHDVALCFFHRDVALRFFHHDISLCFFHRDFPLTFFHRDVALRFFHHDVALRFFHRDIALHFFHHDVALRFFHRDFPVSFFHRDVALSVFHRDLSLRFFHRDIAVHFFHRDVALSVFHRDLSLRFFHRDIAVHFFHPDVALSVFHRDLSVRFFHHDVTLRFFHHDVPLSFFHRDIALRFFHHDVALCFFHRDVALCFFHRDFPLTFFHRDVALRFFHHDVALRFFHRDIALHFFHHDVALRFFHHDFSLSFFHRSSTVTSPSTSSTMTSPSASSTVTSASGSSTVTSPSTSSTLTSPRASKSPTKTPVATRCVLSVRLTTSFNITDPSISDIATGAALPVATEWPVTEDDYTSVMHLSSVIHTDYFEPTLPTTTEGDFAFPVGTTFLSEANGESPEADGEGEGPSPGGTLSSGLGSSEDDPGSVTNTPETFQITEDLQGATEAHLDDKDVLTQVNSSEPSLEKEALKTDPVAEFKEMAAKDVVVSQETPAPSLDDGHEATELITDRYSGITDAPATLLATQEEGLLASPSREKAEDAISSERTSEGEKPSEATPGESSLDDEFTPTAALWEETEDVTPEPQEDTPELSTDAGRKLEDPSSNPTDFPSNPEELPDPETGGGLDAGDSPSLPSKAGPETSQSRPSAGLPSSWLSPTDATFGSSGVSDFAIGSLQASPASVADLGADSGPTGGRGDADPVPSSSGPELNQESVTKVPTGEPEDFVDAEVSNSSPSGRTTDAPSDSVSPRDTPLGPSQLDFDVTDAPSVELPVAPGMSSQLPEESEKGATSTMKEEVEEGSGNPKSDEGTPFASPLPGQESAQGTETPNGENISADLHSGTASSLNPGLETASSELEDNEATATSNSAPNGEINPISSDSATGSENESETLFDIRVTSPPPVDNEDAAKAQEPSEEASTPGSPNGPSSEREGSEVSPSRSPENIGSSAENSEAIPSVASGSDSNKVDTQANSEDHSGTELSPSDTELFPISGTPLPVGKSETLNEQLSPSQSLEENTPTSGSSSSSEGEPSFPSTSPDEALSGPLISESDTTELPPNPLPGSQTSSQPPKENDMENGSADPEDSSAPSIINPQSALSGAGATEEPSISGDLGSGTTLFPKEKRIGSTSEPAVNEEPFSDSDSAQDKTNTPPSEQQLSSENAMETSIPSSAEVPAAKSGTISPLIIDTETSTKAQEPSGEIPSSASLDDLLSSSENEDGEPSPSLSSKTLDSSPSSEGADESRDGEDSTGLASTAKTAMTVSSEGQPGSDLPVRQSVTSPAGEVLALAPIEDGETFVTNEESPSAVPNAKTPSLSVSELSGVQLSGPSASPGSSELSPDDALKARPAASEERQNLEDSSGMTEKETYLTPSTTESLSPDHAETFVSPSVPREEAQLTTGAVSSEDGSKTGAMSQSDSPTEGLETSVSEPAAVGSQSSPDGEVAPETSKETEQLQISAASEKETPLASSTTESQELTTSESGEFSGALSKGSSALPVELAGTANSPSATNQGSQSFPEGVASSAGAENSEDITNMSIEKSSQDPLDRESESKTSTSKEVAGGLSDGESSLNNKGTEIASVESANNAGSQPPPDDAQPGASAASEGSEISEAPSSVNGKEGSLLPSAAESPSTSTSAEEVETSNSESGTNTGSQPSLNGASTAEVQDSERAEAAEDTSMGGEKLPLASSATESQSPGISDSEDVSGGTGNGESSLLAKELEMTDAGSTNNAGAQSSVAGGATEGSGVSSGGEKLGSSSPVNEKETSLGSSAAEASTAPADKEVSGKLSDGAGVETANSEPASNAEPQSPNGAGPDGAASSEEAGIPEVSGVSQKEGSLGASAAESQATSSSNEEAGTSNTATNTGSQLPPDGASAAGPLASDGAEIPEVSASVTGERGPLSPSAAESLSDSSSTEEVGTANTKSTTNGGSQLSAGGASPVGSLASEGAEKTESTSIVNGEKASLAPSATELQFPETSASEKVPGGLDNRESSLSTGEEMASSGSSDNAGSQISPDSVATEGAVVSEGAETSEDNSMVSEKKLSLTPLSTEPQSPATSVSKEVSEKLVHGESSLSTDGRKDTANIGAADTQGPASSTGTVPDQKNIAEQLGEKSDSISGESSVDRAMTSKSSGGTSISGSVSPDGNLATKGTSQDFGATGSSQSSSGIKVDLANPVHTGSGEKSVLPLSGHAVLSSSDTSGGSAFPAPDAKAGGKFLPGASGGSTEALASVRDSVHPSPAEETKPAAGQPSGVAPPFVLLPPNNGLPIGPSGSGATYPGNAADKWLSSFLNQKVGEILAGKVTGKTGSFSSATPADGLSPNELPSSPHGLAVKNGKGSSPPAPKEKGEVVSSSSAAQKGTSTGSTAGGAQPSLLGTKVSPAKTLQLPSGNTGSQVKADSPLLSSKTELTANPEHALAGKLLPSGLASPVSTSASDGNGMGSPSSPHLSEPLWTLIESKIALGLSKAKVGKTKSDVHLALSGLGPLVTTSKTARKGTGSDSKISKKKKTEAADENSAQLGMAAVAPSGAAVSLYPYGASVKDKQYVERKVDFNSPLFKPEIGIPLGNTLRDSLYFTDNGQIVFPASDRDISSYPDPPSSGFNGREKVPMVAVFWENADFSKGSGTIFYQEYPCGNSPKHPIVQDVEAKIRLYVRSSYSARWLLKVTWENVQPYPTQGKSSKTNTYQAILTTDGYRTYALFLYQDGGMQWDYTKLSAPNVLIGYTSGDGYFRNDNLMTKTPAEKYRPDRFQGYNTDVRGLWIYKLDSSIRVNYRQRCLDWIGHEGLPSAWNRNLPPCPCSLQQGMSDNRYALSQKGWLDSGLTLLYASSPNSYRAGVRCLYNKNNQLEEGRQERIWKRSRKNSPNNDEELKFHDWCCNQAGSPQLCEKYNQKRPKIGCQGYKPPVRGEYRVVASGEGAFSWEQKQGHPWGEGGQKDQDGNLRLHNPSPSPFYLGCFFT